MSSRKPLFLGCLGSAQEVEKGEHHWNGSIKTFEALGDGWNEI